MFSKAPVTFKYKSKLYLKGKQCFNTFLKS